MPRHAGPVRASRPASTATRAASPSWWCVDGTHHERRHPHGTPLQKLITLREDLGADLRRKAKRGAPAKGTLEAAARAYLSTITAMPSYKSRRRQIELWVGRSDGGHSPASPTC